MSDTLLPRNASPQEIALDLATSRVGQIPVLLRDVWNPDTCPAPLLGWLAWALSVDSWDPAWAEEDRRAVIRASLAVHRLKGTLAAVKMALEAAGFGAAEVIERFGWDFHDGTHGHDGAITYAEPDHWAEYRVRLTRPITTEQAVEVRAILRNVAPARCHLKALDFTEALNLYNARIAHDGQFTHGVA